MKDRIIGFLAFALFVSVVIMTFDQMKPRKVQVTYATGQTDTVVTNTKLILHDGVLYSVRSSSYGVTSYKEITNEREEK